MLSCLLLRLTNPLLVSAVCGVLGSGSSGDAAAGHGASCGGSASPLSITTRGERDRRSWERMAGKLRCGLSFYIPR